MAKIQSSTSGEVNGIITISTQPAIIAVLPSQATNVTGDGTTYTLDWSSTYIEGITSSSGTQTIPAGGGGNYLVWCALQLSGVTTASNNAIVLACVTTSQTFQMCNYGSAQQATNDNVSVPMCMAIIPMSAGDTLYTTVRVTGGSKTVSVLVEGTYLGMVKLG